MSVQLGFPKYFRCNKCGQTITKAEYPSQVSGMCMANASYRVSGICGGSFTVEMTEEEYNAQIQEWENNRKEKDV